MENILYWLLIILVVVVVAEMLARQMNYKIPVVSDATNSVVARETNRSTSVQTPMSGQTPLSGPSSFYPGEETVVPFVQNN